MGGCSFSLPFPLLVEPAESSGSTEVEGCSMDSIGLAHTGKKREEKDGNASLEAASLMSKILCGSCIEAELPTRTVSFPFQLDSGTDPSPWSIGLAHVMEDDGEKA